MSGRDPPDVYKRQVYNSPLNLLCRSGRLGYWFTIALFEYYLLYTLFRWICYRLHRHEGTDWLLLSGSAILYFAVTQSVLNRLGVNNETISLLGLDQLRFFFYFAIEMCIRDRLSTYPCSVLDNYRFDNQVKCWKFVIVIST